MSEYSYFRAEGRSVEAIKMVEEAKNKIKEVSQKLSKDYGAKGFMPSISPIFHYASSKDVPENFIIDDIQLDNDDINEVAAFAHPKPGTQTELNISIPLGQIESLRKQSTLEGVFSCGDMPEKKLPAGRYSRAFVRSRDYISKDIGNPYDGIKGSDEGTIPDTTTMCSASNSAIRGVNPLSYAKLDGNWYIRVPNDKQGKPLFMPPDSKPMAYKDMCELDRCEWNLQRGYKRPFVPGL